jgi:hypothetical protein
MSRKKLDMQEQRLNIFIRDHWLCRVCGKPIVGNDNLPQLAHRIAQTKANLRKYGADVIHHPLNMMSVCSLRCNSACNIGNRPGEVAELINQIKEEL